MADDPGKTPTGDTRATSTEAYSQDQFSGEKRFCDVVMKGGVTSGVVYPFAITELATKYRFKNIGGASAGAIAAGIAAAAEYARDTGGFLRMAAIPEQMSDRLFSLFQPQPRLRPLFHMLLAMLGKRPIHRKGAALAWAIVRGYPLTILLGAAPALGLVAAASRGHRWDTWVAAVAVLVLGITTALALRMRRALLVDLPRCSYGICSGLEQPGYRTPALTEWLADTLDQIAGCKEPLTFGDLIGGVAAMPRINLEIMTTNLTAGRPHRIPFDTRIFMFKESEWRKIFPARIMDFIMKRSGEVDEHPGYRWLPRTPDLPVVVAIRLSLSFPVLLTAVPLYARDYTHLDEDARAVPRRSWFSDGGICSNFPIHFFDSIWPRWPTFGITLEPYHPQHHKERVFLPSEARQGALKNFGPVESMHAFAGAIIDTMQNWHDNMQTTMPGYRDRIVHVRLNENEGGLNLDMPPRLIQRLSGYGRTAGERLREGFDWNAHRWTRYVISMARLEGTLEEMNHAYRTAAPLDQDLAHVLASDVEPPRYRQTKAWREAAFFRAEGLMREARAWGAAASLRGDDIPHPDVDLRITPRV